MKTSVSYFTTEPQDSVEYLEVMGPKGFSSILLGSIFSMRVAIACEGSPGFLP